MSLGGTRRTTAKVYVCPPSSPERSGLPRPQGKIIEVRERTRYRGEDIKRRRLAECTAHKKREGIYYDVEVRIVYEHAKYGQSK
jgi:hypothetical protein